jgi:hypothetical protein
MPQAESSFEAFQPPGSISNVVEGPALASATTITPTNYIHTVTGTVQVATITVPYAGFSGTICLIFTDNSPGATLTTGNIAIATTVVQKKALFMTWSPSLAKWCPSY